MSVVAGSPFTASIVDGYPLSGSVGARVEVPVTREIVSYWVPATSSVDGDGNKVWSATLDGVPETPVLNQASQLVGGPGLYNLVWMDGGDTWEVFVPLQVLAAGTVITSIADFPDVDLDQVTPDVDDVGAIERIRTTERGGGLAGTFTPLTTPTDDQVAAYIEDARDDVLIQLPEQFPTKYYGQVKRAIALAAALIVESSDYPESNEPDVARKTNLLSTLITSLNNRIATEYSESYAAAEAMIGPVLT